MGSVNGSEGEDLGVIDFSSVDFGALVDEDETPELEPESSLEQEYVTDGAVETGSDQESVTDETSVDSFADLFSGEDLDTEDDPAAMFEPEGLHEQSFDSGLVGDELPPESSDPNPGSKEVYAIPDSNAADTEGGGEVKVDTAPGSSAGVTEQDRVLDSSADVAEQEPFLEPSDPVDSRGRGTYDPFA